MSETPPAGQTPDRDPSLDAGQANDPPPRASQAAGVPVGAPPQKGWFGRNWKWFVPVIALVVLAPCLICGGVFGAAWFGITKALKDSGAFTQSLPMVQNSAAVQAELGSPIEFDGISGGSINSQSGGSGDATINYSVKGPKGTADVTAEGVKRAGTWSITGLTVATSTGKTIQLVPAAGSGQSPPAGTAP